jgi:hypothetical protein
MEMTGSGMEKLYTDPACVQKESPGQMAKDRSASIGAFPLQKL